MSEKKEPKTERQLVQDLHYDYQDMMMHAPIGIFVSTPGGRYVYVNLALARMLGYDSPQETMDSIVNIGEQIYADPEDRGKNLRWLEEHDERLNNECRLVRKDGSQFWGSYNVRAVRNDKGDIVYYEGFAWDISDRKQTEQSLLRTQFAMDRAPDSILWVDDEGRIVYANDAARSSLGYELEELMEMKVFDIDPDFPPDQWERHKETMRKQGSLTFESRHRAKNGRTFPVEVSTNHFYYNDRFLACAFDRDITERKRAETELRDSEGVLRSLFAAAPVGVILMKDRVLRKVNKTLSRITGYGEDEMIGMSTRIFYHDDEEFQRIGKGLYEQMELEGLGVKEAVFRRKDGDLINVVLSISPFDPDDLSVGVCGIVQDITERKRTEEALRESEERLRLLSDVTMEGIIIHKHGVVVDSNFSITKMTGYQRDELLGNNIIELAVHKDDKDIVSENIVKEHAQPYIVRCVRKNGEVFFAELEARNFKYQGESLRVVAIRDITDRKRSEDALRESEEKFRILADSTPTAVMVYQDNRYIYANRAAETITGYSSEEILSMNFWEFIHPDFRAIVQERGRKRQRGKETINRYELKVVTKDGEERWTHLSGATTMIGGRPAGIISVIDITDRKHAEEALRESELKYRFLTESMTDIVWTTDLNFKIAYVSPSVTKVLGFTPEERRLQNVEDTMTKESYDTILSLLARELEAERNGTLDPDRFKLVQTEFYHREGHTVWIESNIRFIRDREGNPVGIHGVSRDITERRLAEEERERLKEQLNRAQKLEAVGTLAGGIAHDFNNLLMGIQGNASLMMLELDPADSHYERLQQIEEQVKGGANLTRQLLGFARGGRYELKPTDMNEIVEKTAVMFGRTKKEITIYKKYEKDLWAVEADRTQMGQVFMNLFVNAWQAMPGGGEIFLETDNILLDEARATGLALSPGKHVRFSVTDTGTGMDAKTLERIFDPFFTTKGMGRGTGLGLATVYGIIKGHGGVIHVTSNPGEGSTFVIYLPASEKAVVREMNAKTEALRGTETILLVDDEAIVLDVTSRMLRSLGYKVHCSGSGQEAVAILCEKKIEVDLVILDMIMPGISGNETFDRLRKIDPKMKVLLSSGYSIDGMAQELLEKGCNGFLQKPFMIAELAREVRAILDSEKKH